MKFQLGSAWILKAHSSKTAERTGWRWIFHQISSILAIEPSRSLEFKFLRRTCILVSLIHMQKRWSTIMEILHSARYVLGVGEAKLAILLRKKPSKTTAEAELSLKERWRSGLCHFWSCLLLKSWTKFVQISSKSYINWQLIWTRKLDCTRTSLLPITFYYPMPSLERILTRTSFSNSGFPLGPILLQNHLLSRAQQDWIT